MSEFNSTDHDDIARKAELEHASKLAKIKNDAFEQRYGKQKQLMQKRMLYSLCLTFIFMIFFFVSTTNPEIYNIDSSTVSTINQAMNALFLLTIPFLLGSLGGAARILIADIKIKSKGNLIISSGLMAAISWIGVKSGVLVAVIAPHLEKAGATAEVTIQSSNDFYTMALVAVFVGMFSTNLYLMISQKVDQLTAQRKNTPEQQNPS